MRFINKDAITERIGEIKARIGCDRFLSEYEQGVNFGKEYVCEEIEHSLDTFEGKDVNLKEEIDNVWNPHFNLGWDDNSLVSINRKSFEFIAKHFFELGLNASMETK